MDLWIDGLGPMENWSLQEVALLIWVSWYFQVPKLFEQATSVAMSMTEDVTDQCMGFPIPNAVFGKQLGNNVLQMFCGSFLIKF